MTPAAASSSCGRRTWAIWGRGLTARSDLAVVTDPGSSSPALLAKLNRRSSYTYRAVMARARPAAPGPGVLPPPPQCLAGAGTTAGSSDQRARLKPELGSETLGDELLRGVHLHGRIAKERSHPGTVQQRHRDVRERFGVRVGAELAAFHSRADQPRHPLPVTVVEAGGHGAQRRLAHRPQPQLDPEHPLALLRAGQRQALADAAGERLGGGLL